MKNRVNIITGIFTVILLAGCAPFEGPIIDEDAEPEVIAEGFEFTEGPYWHSDGYLLFADIPSNRIYRWVPGGKVEVYIDSSKAASGINITADGSIVVAQNTGRLSRVRADGELEMLVDSYQGMKLNSPNDLVVHSSGAIYFTDPYFGIRNENRELTFSGVYKLSSDGKLTLISDALEQPNGIVLSPEQTDLYVNDSATGIITVFNVDLDGNVSDPREFARVEPGSDSGAADGMAADLQGRVYTTGPGGLSIFDHSGERVEMIPFDQRITNIAWGGEFYDHLYITSMDKIYRLQFNVTGFSF